MQKILKTIGIVIISVNITGWVIILLSMFKYLPGTFDDIYQNFIIPVWLGSFVALAVFIILYTLYTSAPKKQDTAPENGKWPLKRVRSILYTVTFIIFLIALLIMFMQNASYSWLGAILFSVSALMALVLLIGFGIYDLMQKFSKK